MGVIMYKGKAYGGGNGGSGGGLTIIPKTKAEYEALSEEEKKRDDVIYEITDQTGGVKFGSADISGIGDGTVTGAISAVNGNLSSINMVQNFTLKSASTDSVQSSEADISDVLTVSKGVYLVNFVGRREHQFDSLLAIRFGSDFSHIVLQDVTDCFSTVIEVTEDTVPIKLTIYNNGDAPKSFTYHKLLTRASIIKLR